MIDPRRSPGANPPTYPPLPDSFSFVSDTDPDFHLPEPRARKDRHPSSFLSRLSSLGNKTRRPGRP
ncbi:MAG TPA: hypothetical protein VGN49_07365 [Micrococcaceae bacterium]|jgi:hypothetical protein|nr:hypothetical protein [Micrococcaceae bacterium]